MLQKAYNLPIKYKGEEDTEQHKVWGGFPGTINLCPHKVGWIETPFRTNDPVCKLSTTGSKQCRAVLSELMLSLCYKK